MTIMSTCPVCLRPRGWHDVCLYAAISWRVAGQYDAIADSHAVRRFAPVCYLYGTAKSEHAKHVHPGRWGGPGTWSDMAGACARCNWLKSDRAGILTAEQLARAAGRLPAAFDRCNNS